jgi:hypothetical protein
MRQGAQNDFIYDPLSISHRCEACGPGLSGLFSLSGIPRKACAVKQNQQPGFFSAHPRRAAGGFVFESKKV